MTSVRRGKIVTAAFAPGATTANDSINLPAGYPEIGEILGGETSLVVTGGAAVDTFSTQALAPEVYASGSTTSNKIQKVDGNTVMIGNNTIASDLLVVVYRSV